MKIAVALDRDAIAAHFGRCTAFAVFQTDDDSRVSHSADLAPPEHQPGAFPAFLHENGVDCLICGGIGPRAVDLLNRFNIQVAMTDLTDPREAVARLLDGNLPEGDNACDH